jgi:hypothetical protein
MTVKERAAKHLRTAANVLAKGGYFGNDLSDILRLATKLEQEAGKGDRTFYAPKEETSSK